MFPRVEIKEYAKEKFKDHYWTMVGVTVVASLIMGAASYITLGLGSFFLDPPVQVGLAFFSYLVYQGGKPEFGEMFSIGFDDYGRKLGGILWTWLFAFLWMLLLIVPGVIKSIAYSMTPYLLAEYRNIPATEAIKVSMKITDGRKWDMFIMYLSFIGWILLGSITFGITHIFYSGPYMNTAFAGMYDVLKKDALETGRITLAELGVYPEQAPNPDPNPDQGPQDPVN